jgi:hypothetical protein
MTIFYDSGQLETDVLRR